MRFYLNNLISRLSDLLEDPDKRRLIFSGGGVLFLILILIISARLSAQLQNQPPTPPQDSSVSTTPQNQTQNPAESPTQEQQENEQNLVSDDSVQIEEIPPEVLEKFPVDAQNKVADAIINGEKIGTSLDRMLYKSSAYTIVHIFKFDVFEISIFTTSFGTTRVQAEQKLVTLLGVDKKIICDNLTVQISAPNSTDPSLQGKNFPLSFCGQT